MNSAPKFHVVEYTPRYHHSTDALIGSYCTTIATAYTLGYARLLQRKRSIENGPDCWDVKTSVLERQADGYFREPVEFASPVARPSLLDDEIPF